MSGKLTIKTTDKTATGNQGDLKAKDLTTAASDAQATADAQAQATAAAADATKQEVAKDLADLAPVARNLPEVKLVLAGGLKRYTRGQSTFTDQKVYIVTGEQALTLLGWEIDGVPVFKRFKAEKPKAEPVHTPASQPREVRLSQEPNAVQALDVPNAADRRIQIGSPEEEAELFGGLEDEGQAI